MAVEIGTVQTFPDVKPDKAQALKVLEEAAEVFGAWQLLQLDTSDVDRFNYELNFLPQELPGVKITSKE